MNFTFTKDDFPIFSNNQLAKHYLDSASTTQKPESVIDVVRQVLSSEMANPHRGAYRLSENLTEKIEKVRAKVHEYFFVPESHVVVFTHGATDGLNSLAQMVTPFIKKEDEILVTSLEHHANFLPWERIAKNTGAKFGIIDLPIDREVNVNDVFSKVSKQTKIIALTHVSNVLGSILPVEEIYTEANKRGIRLIIDASQGAAHLPLSISNTLVDAYICSSHKMYGPSGVGIMILNREWAENFEPYQLGGGMIAELNEQQNIWQDLPARFEAGTMPIESLLGFGEAINYLMSMDKNMIANRLKELRNNTYERLQKIPRVKVFGPENGFSTVSFSVEGIHSHDMATILDARNVCVRSGHHCAKPLMKTLGLSALTRASFGIYSDQSDVDALISGIEHSKNILL